MTTLTERKIELGLIYGFIFFYVFQAFLLIVLCVPMSYLVGVVGQRCCGARSEAELEMEKMDKIYQEVRHSCTYLRKLPVMPRR